MNSNLFRALLSMVLMLTIGCTAANRSVKTESPSPAAKEKVPVKKAKTHGNYTVQKGDTLWGISSREPNYGDPFAWPLIFKSNKSKIQDPDLIYPNQELTIQKGQTAAELAKAKKQAHDTPPSAPHIKPRATLPVNYDE